ncbi:MAG TPA: pur operon repressor, partial [Limnochordia bacterium]
MRRAQRLAVLTRLLTDRPGVSYTLSQLAMRCGVSKPTISADIAELKALFAREGLGELETAVGVNGGVRFFKAPSPAEIAAAVRRLCELLADPRRILPGGFLYLSDLISTPGITQPLAEAFAARFRKAGPEAVVTVETGGIPVAVLTARALAVPLVVARRTTRVSEGTVVTMNYFTGSARRLETMSLPLRALERGTRVLII